MGAVVIAARRTAVVPRGGIFARLSIEELATPVIRAVIADAGIALADIDEVIVANALGAGGNPARRIALAAGLPERVAGLSIDRQCAGGLDAILIARALIESGAARIVVAGGVESYSRRPLRLMTDPDGGPPVAYDQPPFTPWPDRDPNMTQAAATLAMRLGIDRQMQEVWAIDSHCKAWIGGPQAEIVPLLGQDRDPYTRQLTPMAVARARVLAGSVSTASVAVAADAAAFVVVADHGLSRPGTMKIGPGITLGAAPEEPGLAPLPAIRWVLKSAGLVSSDLTQVELMEAYAVQAIACANGARLDSAKINIRGGALARGHPIGASGAILAVRLFHDLAQGTALAAIASAGGLGSAVLFGR